MMLEIIKFTYLPLISFDLYSRCVNSTHYVYYTINSVYMYIVHICMCTKKGAIFLP